MLTDRYCRIASANDNYGYSNDGNEAAQYVQRPERGGRCGAETVVLIPPYARQSYSDRRFPTVTSTCKPGSKFYQAMRAETMMLYSVGQCSACVGLHQVKRQEFLGAGKESLSVGPRCGSSP